MWWWMGCFSTVPSPPTPTAPAPPAAPLPPGALTYTETAVVGSPCEAHDLIVRLTRGGQRVEEKRFPGSCSGPCTEKEQQQAQRESAELLRRYEAGELTSSEIDDDITTCYTLTSTVEEEFTLDGRPGVLVSHPFLQPHAGTGTWYQVLVDACGGLFASTKFGARYGNAWERIELETTGTEVTVTGWMGDSSELLFRLDTSRCPSAGASGE